MILKNPLEVEVSIGILGNEYSIPAKETLFVPDTIGITWKKIHGFLQIVTEKEPTIKEELPETPETPEVPVIKEVIKKGTKK